MKRATRRTVAFGAAGIASGLALAALLLPQLVNTVGPTPLGIALLTVALTLLSTIGQRLDKLYSRRRTLVDALCVWPPQPLREADPATLGVYPARERSGQPEPYRPRTEREDERLRDALKRPTTVIVHGPPRAGKSRAASEAARRALADVPVIVPVDSHGLASLVDSGIPQNALGQRVCLWLDGLDRFIEGLDARTLSKLQDISDNVQIVATIRTEQWVELVTGTGQPSQAARILAADASVVKLGPLGSGDAQHSSQSTPAQPDEEKDVTPPPPWRDRGVAALTALLLATLVAILVAGLQKDLLKPPSIDSQINRIKAELRAEIGPGGAHFVVDQRVRLHSTEADSWIVVVEDGASHDAFGKRVEMCQTMCRGPAPRSDELRIYDVHGGRLQLELDFRPRGSGPIAEEWQQLRGQTAIAADYDQDNLPEIVAGYALRDRAYEAVLPFGIVWQNGSYALMSLTPDPPELSSRTLDPITTEYRREVYLTKLTIRTGSTDPRFNGLQLDGYRAQAFALAQQPNPRLLTAYDTSPPSSTTDVVLELHASQIRVGGTLTLQPCTPTSSACTAPAREQDVIVPPDREADSALLTAWAMVGNKWEGQIRVTTPHVRGRRLARGQAR